MRLFKDVFYMCHSCHLGQTMPKAKDANIELVLKAYRSNVAII